MFCFCAVACTPPTPSTIDIRCNLFCLPRCSSFQLILIALHVSVFATHSHSATCFCICYCQVVNANGYRNSSLSTDIMAYSPTTFNDLIQSFSQPDLKKIITGYLVMVCKFVNVCYLKGYIR